ncbi:methyltransferase domain-containing protein [Nonomuraea sp. NPDC003709]|uniref:methyltransferase domain-containing protein n=1 Tax=Nonomuraea sp. NPDC003709 TaxID=3154450 RepID=UPI0033A1A137
MDEGGMAERRQSLLSGLTGEVVEVGAPVAVEVVPGLAEHLPLADRSVDAVAFCMVLCSLPDVGALVGQDDQVGGVQAAQDAPDPGGSEVVYRAG